MSSQRSDSDEGEGRYADLFVDAQGHDYELDDALDPDYEDDGDDGEDEEDEDASHDNADEDEFHGTYHFLLEIWHGLTSKNRCGRRGGHPVHCRSRGCRK
jgi:hypothetical protein